MSVQQEVAKAVYNYEQEQRKLIKTKAVMFVWAFMMCTSFLLSMAFVAYDVFVFEQRPSSLPAAGLLWFLEVIVTGFTMVEARKR